MDGDGAEGQRQLGTKPPAPALGSPGVIFTAAASNLAYLDENVALCVKGAAAPAQPSYLSERPSTQHGIKRNVVFSSKKGTSVIFLLKQKKKTTS